MLRSSNLLKQVRLVNGAARKFTPPPNFSKDGKFGEPIFDSNGKEEIRSEYK
jgi:hypothetical protein